ncbi:MAG: hypothetical protein WC806_04025 [Candidatus Gracilibacteria bacterium]|jgi:phytoene/squalene synthetase
MNKPEIKTGYEGFNPLTGNLSQTLTNINVIRAMFARAQEKNEKGYIDYMLKLNAHHIMGALQLVGKFYTRVMDDFNGGILKLPNAPERIEVLNKVYVACRILDDAIDGDSPNKLSAEETLTYATDVVDNFKNGKVDTRNAVDVFLGDAMKKCEEIGIDIKAQVLLVLESVKFDAGRRSEFLKTGTPKFYPESQLAEYYCRLDIEGTVGACLEITDEGDSKKNRDLIAPLAISARDFYDVRDLAKEVRQGLVSISIEDAKRLNIDMGSLLDWAQNDRNYSTAPHGVKMWIKERIDAGEALLKDHFKIMEAAPFKKSTASILQKSFVDQAEPFFAKMRPMIEHWAL